MSAYYVLSTELVAEGNFYCLVGCTDRLYKWWDADSDVAHQSAAKLKVGSHRNILRERAIKPGPEDAQQNTSLLTTPQ